MKAVILAAGFGRRMGEKPKGLLKVGGREIIYRNMKLMEENGVDEFIIVTNKKYEGNFKDLLKRSGFKGKVLVNEDPERGNGYSLHIAKEHVDGKFVLLMSDHIFSKEFLEAAITREGAIIDGNPEFVDIREATKVKVENGSVADIGKGLEEWDGVDTGFFILDENIFRVAEELVTKKERVGMSDIVRKAKLKVSYISGLFWMDIDTPEDLKRARHFLIRNSIKGAGDGFVSRYFNRKISTRISELLVERITPNQMTVITFAMGILSAFVVFFSPSLGGVLYQISSILDGVDGEIARASMRTSRFGGYLDSIMDRYVDFAFLLSLAVVHGGATFFWIWTLLAIFGSFMVSYSTERYKAAYGKDVYKRIPKMRYLIGKRDERIFLTMIMILVGWVYALFVVLALITHLRVLATIYLIKKNMED
ncbi:MAG: NTP transferase domain-containing protein [Palaeococcus sp.]|uniref:bifunctional L-myo-inositol-1-phosphate cytidylyltransferase/CDP-L-myo-inositol myo-inositolphosphotransferase n=1 Tax=Palaeococcus sp. (in: euryarchaeotes) TaxID=2820298 RepID=UPI0025CCA729|nr:bifunctional L-myo-inositol-1-phosphate cytidylyltransferase/CDP-L-myo-inositol myo-inositolphosphotransferase [Palaeococcus sp. (in: euryarchaeotes)]MCD6559284.1 NTP transferase domain-containing protein [Palaeococcus sp. (in: euryarchaeotes)]